MRIPLITAIALAALTTSAQAADKPAAGSAPATTVVTEFPDVKTTITISDASGTAVKTLACEWTEPQEDDRPCIRFQGDPQNAFEAIEEAGGDRADQLTTTQGGEMRVSYAKRVDGTWLIRHRGVINHQNNDFGHVCTADGQKCVRWDASGAKSARKHVKAAAAKLRRK